MGRKNQKKSKPKVDGMSMDPLDAEISDLFKTLPPNKRAELTKIVEKLFQVSSNFTSEPTTPAKQWEEFKEISSLVEKVRAIESGHSMCRTLPDRKASIRPFTTWLADLGAVIRKVEIADFGAQGLGLKLTESCEKAEELIRIPSKAMMSVETAKASSISKLIERDPILKTMSNVTLAIHLLIERNSPASFWEPYINMLPHTYNTVLYFTPKQMESLKGSPVLEMALNQYKAVARQYAYFYKLLSNTMLKDYITYDEYRWAVSTVTTRQNLVPENADSVAGSVNTLIPFWDMANHDKGVVSTDYDPEKGESVCFAQRDFKAGEQLTICYGLRSNHEFLVHNGFVFPDNENDYLSVRLGVAKTDPLVGARLELLKRLGIVSQKFCLRRNEEPLDVALVAFLRVLQMDQAQIGEWDNKESIQELTDLKVWQPVDSKVMQYMITRAALLLRAYPTTMEQDQLLLQDITNPIDRMICELRLSEKTILLKCVAYCEQQLELLKNKPVQPQPGAPAEEQQPKANNQPQEAVPDASK